METAQWANKGSAALIPSFRNYFKNIVKLKIDFVDNFLFFRNEE